MEHPKDSEIQTAPPAPPGPGPSYESTESDEKTSASSSQAPGLKHEGDQQPLPSPTVHTTSVHPSSKHNLRHSDFWRGAHHKEWSKSPWIQMPLGEEHDRWLHEEQQATEWLSLFYDLVVVAVLTVFSASHELAAVSDIPNFLGFFTVVYWVWVSQTHYDMRFQANDTLNRLFKFPQICVFIYQGATSGNWDPKNIQSEDPSTVEGAEHLDNYNSFNGVLIALIVSRGLLAAQFLIAAYLGRKVGRRIGYLKRTIAALFLSTACIIVALALPPHSPSLVATQIALLYVGLAIEAVDVFAHIVLRPRPPFEASKLGERYGAFILVILGEGMISLTRAFTWTLSALSIHDGVAYVKVFLGILIIYLLWGFLFARFDQDDAPSQSRALAWSIVHFPLAFGLLLLLASLVNTTLTVASSNGVNAILDEYYTIIVHAQDGTPLEEDDYRWINGRFRKLELQPAFLNQFDYMTSLYQSPNPSADPNITVVQYLAQIVWETNWLYGIEIPDHASHLYDEIDAINTTWSGNHTLQNDLFDETVTLFSEFVSEPLNEAFTGMLWLIPVAGGVLVLCAIRSMLWYRFKGPAHWIIHGPQLLGGVALGFLGFLDMGNKNVELVIEKPAYLDLQHVNPLYRVVTHDVPLAVVAGVYLVSYLGSVIALHIFARKSARAAGISPGALA